jgi:hypothetical protein
MAGDFFAKERSIITLTTSGASLTTGSAGTAAGTSVLDMRASGNAADDFQAQFYFICRWTTITSIAAGTIAADLYLIPALDGTNYPSFDATSGSSRIPFACWAASFECPMAPTSATDMYFVSPLVSLPPRLYLPYILNRSGQTMTSNWTLKCVTDRAQYN